jgi:hypothetical protein
MRTRFLDVVFVMLSAPTGLCRTGPFTLSSLRALPRDDVEEQVGKRSASAG